MVSVIVFGYFLFKLGDTGLRAALSPTYLNFVVGLVLSLQIMSVCERLNNLPAAMEVRKNFF